MKGYKKPMTHHHLLTEAQSYQSVGQLSPDAEATLTSQKAWDGLAASPPTAIEPIDQLQAPDFSFWNKRANTQALAITDDDNFAVDFFSPQTKNHEDTPPLAGYGIGGGQSYDQTPTAATDPSPLKQAPDGTVSGADAASEQSGNAGFLTPSRS